jgi:hypothetical protein
VIGLGTNREKKPHSELVKIKYDHSKGSNDSWMVSPMSPTVKCVPKRGSEKVENAQFFGSKIASSVR